MNPFKTSAHRVAPFPKKTAELGGKRMAYVELGVEPDGGAAPVFLFLHGNPTSSYLWRNVMPPLRGCGRLHRARPDRHGRLGQARQSRPRDLPLRRRIARSSTRFSTRVIGPARPVVLVGHDWGSALGFDWANRHRGPGRRHRLYGGDRQAADLGRWPEASRRVFQGFRSPAGEEMILDRNVFVERVLPGSILRKLDPAEMDVTAGPFAGAARIAGRRSPGRARSRSTASPRTSSPSSPPTPSGWRGTTYRSCSSTPSRARS